MIDEVSISEDSKVLSQHSPGSQLKYRVNNLWYKVNTIGDEANAECVTSIILKHSTITHFTDYSLVRVNGRLSCVSKDFCKDKEFITLQKLYYSRHHQSLSNDIMAFTTAELRYQYLLQVCRELTGLDMQEYLDANLCLDFLILNPDRHFNNLGVLIDNEGKFSLAPIFDNGQGLGANWQITPPDLSYHECYNTLTANTISGSFSAQFAVTKYRFKIDYHEVAKELKAYESKTRCLKILHEQMTKYRDIFEM